MATGVEEKEFAAYVVDLLQGVGPVYSRRMFGGFGLFLQGLMFGLITDNTLYLKVDDEIRADFDELGLQAFSYLKQGKTKLSYFQAPEEAMDNPELMSEWGSKCYGAALRAAAKKRRKLDSS
jgi:DNA transformation protein and related proteins